MKGVRSYLFLPFLLLLFLASPLWAGPFDPVPEGDKAPAFEVANFKLEEAIKKGPVVLVFYRGLF